VKARFRNIFIKLININILWFFIRPFAKFGFSAHHYRKKPVVKINQENFPYLYIFKDKTVLHGPFGGMKYPSLSSVGSVVYPKLIGSYERELHGIIDAFILNHYTEVMDIGCAEGYYAVGLGLKLNNAKIYAYDTDETARKLCYDMAKLNGIEKKVTIKKTCTAEELAEFNFSGRGLVVCDCEGFEKYLFNEGNISNLKKCDLLIETHDFLDLSISGDLVRLFNNTHHIQIIKSIDDIEKAKTYVYDETNNLTLDQKMSLYRECRPAIMEWLICTSKHI
jgi:Ribosomal protein L11 methyltransferase (PrmA)